MSDLTRFEFSENDEPLPLQVAAKWNFPLTYIVTDSNETLYHIVEWIAGVTQSSDSGAIWRQMRRGTKTWANMRTQTLNAELKLHKLPYTATNGAAYQMDFANEDALLFILVQLRITAIRTRLAYVRNYLVDIHPHLSHLRCAIPVKVQQISERYVQSAVVECLRSIGFYDVQQYVTLPTGRVIDVLAFNPQQRRLIVECKVIPTEHHLYQAIGQLMMYKAEIEQQSSGIELVIASIGSLPERDMVLLERVGIVYFDIENPQPVLDALKRLFGLKRRRASSG